jgi:hypothetical protein
MTGGDTSSPFFFALVGGNGPIGTAAAAQLLAPWRRRGRPPSGGERNRGPGASPSHRSTINDRDGHRRLCRCNLRCGVGIHHHTTTTAAISGGGTGRSPRPGGSIAAERAMSSSGIVRSLTNPRKTPPFAFPVFCCTIGWVLDDEQCWRTNKSTDKPT